MGRRILFHQSRISEIHTTSLCSINRFAFFCLSLSQDITAHNYFCWCCRPRRPSVLPATHHLLKTHQIFTKKERYSKRIFCLIFLWDRRTPQKIKWPHSSKHLSSAWLSGMITGQSQLEISKISIKLLFQHSVSDTSFNYNSQPIS